MSLTVLRIHNSDIFKRIYSFIRCIACHDAHFLGSAIGVVESKKPFSLVQFHTNPEYFFKTLCQFILIVMETSFQVYVNPNGLLQGKFGNLWILY